MEYTTNIKVYLLPFLMLIFPKLLFTDDLEKKICIVIYLLYLLLHYTFSSGVCFLNCSVVFFLLLFI